MSLKFHRFFLVLFVIASSAACNLTIPERNVPTQENRFGSATSDDLPINQITSLPSNNLTSFPISQPQITRVSTDFDGVMVITQYYTLARYGHYEEAFQLLSKNSLNSANLFEYINKQEAAGIESITLYSIQPYYEWALKEGFQPQKDPEGQRRFIVWFSAEGEGGMAGSVPNGAIQHPIVTLVLEEDNWRILSTDTIPIP